MRRTRLAIAGLAATLVFGAAAVGTAKQPDDRGRPDDKPAKNVKARSLLVRDAGGIDDNAKGRIDLHVKGGDRTDLRIHAQRLDAGLSVDFTIEDDLGDEVVIGSAVVTSDKGSAKLTFKTKQGDTLPLDAASGSDLAGHVVRVRENGTDEPILIGRVPGAPANAKAKLREKADLTNDAPETDDDAKGRVCASWRARDGRSELKIAAKNLTPGAAVTFLIADGAGELEEVGTATVNPDGEATLRVRTKHGAPLPLGAMDIMDLAGRALRVDVAGAAQLSGAIPGGA